MEKGNLRADVNVSVRKPGAPLGTRCEIKNVNSIRFIGQAIEHEAWRQIGIIEDGGTIEQETRLFDPDKGETRSDAHQGRGARLSLLPRSRSVAARACAGAGRRSCGRACRNCPTRRRRACRASSACTANDADVIVAEPATADVLRTGRRRRPRRAEAAANWVINELAGRLNKEGQDIARSPVSAPRSSAIILDLIADGTISGKIAKDVFEIVWTEGGDPRADRRKPRTARRSPTFGAIEKLVDDIIAQQSRQGGAGQDQAERARLVRRPGDEGVRRQSQPAGGQRPAQEDGSASDSGARRVRVDSSPTIAADRGDDPASGCHERRFSSPSRRRGANRLAPIRAFCAPCGRPTRPRRASAAKFFQRSESGCGAALSRMMAFAARLRRAHEQQEIASTDSDKTHCSSAFSAHDLKTRAGTRRAKFFCRCAGGAIGARSRGQSSGGSYTQN